MPRIGAITGYSNSAGGLDVFVKSWEDTSPFTDYGTDLVHFSTVGLMTAAQVKDAAIAAILAFATANSFSFSTLIKDLGADVPGLASAPAAAIADAPADAVTNYNAVTTLLGALTGAVNTANTKQNDIATKLNALLAELRTLGLITP